MGKSIRRNLGNKRTSEKSRKSGKSRNLRKMGKSRNLRKNSKKSKKFRKKTFKTK